jgi:SH3-like domain-containing protein
MIKRISLFLFFMFFAVYVWAAKPLFPFVADVTAEKVNVRAGLSENFEVLGQVSRGQKLIVVGKEYDWYKIELPSDFTVFVSDKYVATKDGRNGIITGDRVNVRAGLDVNRTALGQLVKGDTVEIIAHHTDWYEIAPTPKIFGWINEEYLAFKSQNIAEAKEEKVLPAETELTEQKTVKADAAVPADGDSKDFVFKGNLQPSLTGSTYQLIVDGKAAYNVEGFQYILDDFLYYDVKIKADKPAFGPTGELPVIKASQIELIF